MDPAKGFSQFGPLFPVNRLLEALIAMIAPTPSIDSVWMELVTPLKPTGPPGSRIISRAKEEV